MAFKYNPKDATSCVPAGEYEATILSVEEGESKTSGNPMLTVTFTVYAGQSERKVKDYIVNPGTLFKLKKIAKALGAEDDFKAGTFDLQQRLNSNLTVELEIQEQAGYDDKNSIVDYKPLERKSAAPGASAKPDTRKAAPLIEDADIPF